MVCSGPTVLSTLRRYTVKPQLFFTTALPTVAAAAAGCSVTPAGRASWFGSARGAGAARVRGAKMAARAKVENCILLVKGRNSWKKETVKSLKLNE